MSVVNGVLGPNTIPATELRSTTTRTSTSQTLAWLNNSSQELAPRRKGVRGRLELDMTAGGHGHFVPVILRLRAPERLFPSRRERATLEFISVWAPGEICFEITASESQFAHWERMISSIAFVGAGPTTLYTLAALLARVSHGVSITVFEEQQTAGLGAPYRPGWNDPAMLSNIASIEIPPLGETLLEWMERRPVTELQALGIEQEEIDDRAFVPRVALGRYFRDQFDALVEAALSRGVDIQIRTRCRVLDVANVVEGMLLTVAPCRGVVDQILFDHVVLATGHQWPAQQEVRPGYFLSPWPATTIAALPPASVGIRGSSLTAIDTAVARRRTRNLRPQGRQAALRTRARERGLPDDDDVAQGSLTRSRLLLSASSRLAFHLYARSH
ncbi:MAG: hypothetical protein JWR59_63 [Brevundimonas sp.]|nr:hypothetical protein [Brevundimonas sp.]